MPTTRLDNPQAGRYATAKRVKTVYRHSGVFALPVAEEPPTDPVERQNWSPVAVVRAHSAYQEETDNFEYEKEDAPPVVPDMADAGHLRFMEGELSVPVPSVNTAGGMTWTAAGEYRYVSAAEADALKRTGIVLGSHPFVLTSQRRDATFPGPTPTDPGSLPPEVAQAGLGPRVGWQLASGQATGTGEADPTAAGYAYREPSYLPGTFFSDDLTVGPADYSGLGGDAFEPELTGSP